MMKVEEILREKLQRIEDVINGKEPDRVPILGATAVWHGAYAGYTTHEVLFDYGKCKSAWLKVARDFEFDTFTVIPGLEGMIYVVAFLKQPDISASARFILGSTHLALMDVFTKWPGYELDKNAHPQFIGKEIMKSNEYDQLIEDPLNFINRVAMTRINKKLSNPGSAEYNSALAKFGVELAKFGAFMADVSAELAKLGYPTVPMAWSYAPLDLIGDFLRDIKNVVMDLYRIGDKVKQAIDAVKPLVVESAMISAPPKEVRKQVFGTEIVECFFPLHLNEYLNPKLYNEFYWPSLNEVFKEVVALGLTPFVLFEGKHDAHLETLKEAPKGKVVGVFEKTDPRKVREVLGDRIILVSGPPNSLLISGTPQKVEDFMKKLLEDCKAGGMMIWPGVDGGISRDAKPENVKAMIDAVKKYGKY
ncbi:MAG: uroporphyrinogen decarboxylase family protein [Archaeoglobaceae archaeon]